MCFLMGCPLEQQQGLAMASRGDNLCTGPVVAREGVWDAWQVLAGKQAVLWAEQALKGSVVHMARATPQLARVPDWQQSRHTLCCAWHSL